MKQKPLSVLIIDDEVLIQKIFKLALQSRGHLVKGALDGVEALKIWKKFNPDLVFLDVLMPRKDGFGVLREKPKKSKAKIVMMSAHDDLDDQKIKETKVDLFVKKPFEDIYLLVQQGENLVQKKLKQ